MRAAILPVRKRERALVGAALLAAATMVASSPLAAQDIEMTAKAAGRPLPKGYYDRIAREPRFFEFPDVWASSAEPIGGPRVALVGPTREGRLPVLVIPALFADSPQPPFQADAIQRALFTGPSQWGTITEVYREMSGGVFEVTGSTSPWVRTATTRAAAVGTSMGLGDDAKMGDYLVQALAAADAHMDFGQFDNNGADGVPNSGDDDGFVDVVSFLTLENAASCGGSGPWPHAAGLANWTGGVPFRSQDLRPNGQPVLVNAYIIQDATSCTGTAPLAPAVIAHELGHRIGLPDLYDARLGIGPETRRWVVGCWDLMSAGSWGCGAGAPPGTKRPTHMGVWSKARMGWVNPTLATNVRDQEYVLRPANEGGGALRLPLGGGESLLLEYRVRQGYDVELAGSGVVITHVDTTKAFLAGPPGSGQYGVWTVEADRDGALKRTATEGGNRGVPGDVHTVLGLTTSASGELLRLNDGSLSTVTIHSLRVDAAAGTATVRVTTSPELQIAALGSAPTWNVLGEGEQRWRVTGGTLPYAAAVTGALPTGVVAEFVGDTLRLRGTPGRAGTFTLAGSVLDAAGRRIALPSATLVIAEPVLAVSRLAGTLLQAGAEPLSAAEAAFLDRSGNDNGRYDVGDLRAYLRRHPELARAMAALR